MVKESNYDGIRVFRCSDITGCVCGAIHSYFNYK